ncbi:MAG: hypothetical protein ACE5EE_06245 [Fidelibacterota bacterium]
MSKIPIIFLTIFLLLSPGFSQSAGKMSIGTDLMSVAYYSLSLNATFSHRASNREHIVSGYVYLPISDNDSIIKAFMASYYTRKYWKTEKEGLFLAWGSRMLYWEWNKFFGISDIRTILASFDGQIGYKWTVTNTFLITPTVSAGPMFGILLNNQISRFPIVIISPWATLELSYRFN